MTNEQLLDLLPFEENLSSVEIISQEDLQNDAIFVVAKLSYPDGFITVPFVYYAGKTWLFTPCDWQGQLPSAPEGVDQTAWRVNDTDVEAVMFEGLPMLAPWTPEPTDELKSVRKAIGARIKAARIAHGWSTRQLADYSGIPLSAISRIENGRLNAKIDTIAAIAHALGISINFD